MKTIIFAAFVGFGLTSAAYADEAEKAGFIEDCEQFKAANNVDGNCECMAEKLENKPDLAAEIMATETLDDVASLSEQALEIIETCS